ncbi:MAG TPA: hypothetical protein VN032_10000 [Thermoanaerobaculia bacterium]|jgi:hypothetical protein|nr:hypothetical protein [Thermoanaerobaculia bacterium]
MITLLAVGAAADALAPAFAQHPSVEVLAASDAEGALEKLARNRRIDAVLLLGGPACAETARMIGEEDPGAPPLYAPASAGAIARVVTLADGDPAAIVEALARLLQPEI